MHVNNAIFRYKIIIKEYNYAIFRYKYDKIIIKKYNYANY